MKHNLLEFLFVALPKALAGLCTLAVNIVLLRFFGPEQYGIYSLCISGILLADAILGSALDLGVIRLASLHRDADPEGCLAVQAIGVFLKLAAVLAITLVLSILAGQLTRTLFHSEGGAHLIYLSCVAVLMLMLLRSAQLHPQIHGRFLQFGLLELLQMTLKYGGIALLLVLGRASPGAVIAFLAAGPLIAFCVFVVVWRRELLPLPALHWPLIKELLHFVKWFFLTFSVSALLSRADIFLLASWSNLHEVGVFSAAQTFAYIPQLLGTYLAVVLSPRVMPYLRAGRFLGFFRKFQIAMLLGCVVLYILAVIGIKMAGPSLLPRSFFASQHIILILLPGALAGLLTFPLTITFLLFVRPRFLLTMDCIALPFMVLLYRYAIHEHGAVGAAWVTSGSFVIKALIAQAKAWALAREGQRQAGIGVAQETVSILTN